MKNRCILHGRVFVMEVSFSEDRFSHEETHHRVLVSLSCQLKTNGIIVNEWIDAKIPIGTLINQGETKNLLYA